jgi:hypothetical protein
MAPWELHELFLLLILRIFLDTQISFLPKWENNILKFNGDVVCVILHISSFLDYVSKLNERHEDVLIILFICSLGEYQ